MSVTMTPPDSAAAFLSAHGWGGATIEPLAGDASFRRYFRVRDGGRCAVLMDAPPPHEDARPFLAVAQRLRALGFHPPQVLAADEAQGLVLLSDLGDDRFREHLEASPGRERALYTAAVELLVALHDHPPGPLAPYDRAVLHREVDLFPDWYAPMAGLVVDRDAWTRAWDAAFARLPDDAPVMVLRDFHAENLMLLPGNTAGEAVLGLLDFQDALAGHAAYDLVSLLQDARRDVDAALEAEMLALYRERTGAGEGFDTAYAILGAQRNVKILGIFARLAERDGKRRYLDYLPRVWGHVRRNLGHPAVAEVADWFRRHVPEAAR